MNKEIIVTLLWNVHWCTSFYPGDDMGFYQSPYLFSVQTLAHLRVLQCNWERASIFEKNMIIDNWYTNSVNSYLHRVLFTWMLYIYATG